MIITRILPFTALLIAAPVSLMAEEVTVFAAASLKNALDEVAEEFSEESGHKVTVSYAGSGKLAQQVVAGAPADLFISANVQWMDEVEKAELVQERQDLLGNKLVLIAYGQDAAPVTISSETDFAKLLDGGKLAMALVNAVPAGQYGKAALENLGLWEKVQADVAQADNVRAALALVSTGEAPYGIVYATDAAADDNVTVVAEFPSETYPPIIYPAALLTEAQDQADRDFYEALKTAEMAEIFERHGFAALN